MIEDKQQIDIIEADIKTGMRIMERVNPRVYRGLSYRTAAKHLEAIGYRKQSEGEWVKPSMRSDIICSQCKRPPKILFGVAPLYCPNCGAKMKGGE